jgi:hypothetical protein
LSLVCLFFLKPDCCLIIMLLESIKHLILIKIKRSANLPIQLVRLIRAVVFRIATVTLFFRQHSDKW